MDDAVPSPVFLSTLSYSLTAQIERYNVYCESGVDEECGNLAECMVTGWKAAEKILANVEVEI